MTRLKFAVIFLVAAAAAFILARMSRRAMPAVFEPFPVLSTDLILTGGFHPVDYQATGEASVYQSGTGARVVRLSEFKTHDAPGLHLYLVAAPDAADDSAVTKAGFLDLGPLRTAVGAQNYDVPPGSDLNRYRAVVVWSSPDARNFAAAALAPPVPPPGHGVHLER
jgi:hypothetical protein